MCACLDEAARARYLILVQGTGRTRVNRYTPNDPYMGRTAPLTSKRCTLYFYSTNVGTEYFNPLTPNDIYISRTAPLTSKRCILYIYSTNIGTEYFKHVLYSPFFLFKMQFVS